MRDTTLIMKAVRAKRFTIIFNLLTIMFHPLIHTPYDLKKILVIERRQAVLKGIVMCFTVQKVFSLFSYFLN